MQFLYIVNTWKIKPRAKSCIVNFSLLTPFYPPPLALTVFPPPIFLVPLSLCREKALPLLFCVFHAFEEFFFYIPLILYLFPFLVYSIHAPACLPSLPGAVSSLPVPVEKVLKMKFVPICSHFLCNVTPMVFSALSVSLFKLPVCLNCTLLHFPL